MKSIDFIPESTQMSLTDGSPIAVKSSLGAGKGSRITMLIQKNVWNAIKHEQANTERMEYDMATAESIIRDWVSNGAQLYWKSAADYNREARDLKNHRFRNDADLKDKFDNGVYTARQNANIAAKSSLSIVDEADRMYSGDPLETGGTSIPGNAAPALRDLFAKNKISEGMKVLDYGAGKYARNAKFLRENGVMVFAYDPFNGTSDNGWEGISTKLPNEQFDVAFTSFVLNVVPNNIENQILDAIGMYASHQYHITRNQDIIASVRNALLRKDTLVGSFFLSHFANDEEKQMYVDGSLTDEVLAAFAKHGVQTSKGFQRIPFLEEKGFTLFRSTASFKIYEK